MIAPREVIAKEKIINRVVRFRGSIFIPSMSTISVPVSYQDKILPDDRDFLFELRFNRNLGFDGGVFAHIVDAGINFVQVRNATELPAKIEKRSQLSGLIEYTKQGAYLVDTAATPLAAGGFLTRRSKQGWESYIKKDTMALAATIAAFNVSLMKPEVGSLASTMTEHFVPMIPT